MSLEKSVNQEHMTEDTIDLQFCSDWMKDEIRRLFSRVKALETQLHECGRSELKHDIRASELAEENAKLRHVVDSIVVIAKEGTVANPYHADRLGRQDMIAIVREALHELDTVSTNNTNGSKNELSK